MPPVNSIKLHAPKLHGKMKDNFGQGSPYAIVPVAWVDYMDAAIAIVARLGKASRYGYRGLLDDLRFTRDRGTFEILSQVPRDRQGATARFKHAALNCARQFVPYCYPSFRASAEYELYGEPTGAEPHILAELQRLHDTTRVLWIEHPVPADF
jgi:hypothetical protein